MRRIDIPKDILYQKYIIEKQPSTQIVKNLNISNSTILKKLREYNIQIRTNSESKKNPTRETRDKMSETRKRLFREGKLIPPTLGKYLSVETRNKISQGNKGKPKSQEHRKKISENDKIRFKDKTKHPMYGKHHTEESIKKMSLSHKGITTWNKNLTKETDERVKKNGEKLSNYLKENDNYWLGKKLSEEHKRKIGLGNKGKVISKESREKISKSNRGRKLSEETRKKMSESSPRRLKERLPKSYGYEFNNILKEQIRKRDNYRCQECFRHKDELFTKNKNGKIVPQKVHIHHIDYNKENNHPNNLISLCKSCHAKTNLHRENWSKYFEPFQENLVEEEWFEDSLIWDNLMDDMIM